MSSALTYGFMQNGFITQNANPTGLTQFQIMKVGHPYKQKLIKMGTDQYSVPENRWEVMHNDPIMLFLWQRYAEEVTAKPFKSYDTDIDGQPTEIMTDIWERWDLLNMNIMLKDIMKYNIVDGFCLNERWVTPNGGIDYNCYGFYHSRPAIWDRINSPFPEMFADHNKIARYKIFFVPHPLGTIYGDTDNMHAVERYIIPGAINLPLDGYDFDHFTRGPFNEGYGNPRAQGLWDSITKIRKYSWSDYRRSIGLPQLQFPSDMDADIVEDMMNAVAHWDENDAIGLPLRVNPTSQETEPYPAYFERTPDQTGAVPKADPTSGGTLLRSAEWALFLAYTGYSETKIVGSQPGAVEGSKLDLTRDDRVDVREFANIVPVIKELLLWLLEVGKLEGCDPESLQYVLDMNYDVKCHIEWEVLENMMAEAEMAEEEAEEQASEGADRGNANQNQELYDKITTELKKLRKQPQSDKRDKRISKLEETLRSIRRERGNAVEFRANAYNLQLTEYLMQCIRDNAAMPMTPTMSSWIKGIGFKDDKLYMETHDGGRYKYDSEQASQIYSDWIISDSKGGFWWDSIRDQLGPSDKVGRIPLPKMFGQKEYDTRAEADRKYKVEGDPAETRLEAPGETREPFKVKPAAQQAPRSPGEIGMGSEPGKTTKGVDVHNKPKLTHMIKRSPKAGPKAAQGRPKATSTRAKPAVKSVRGRANAAFFNNTSFKEFNALMTDKYGAGMSKTTFTNIRKFFDEEFEFRVNSMSLVKVMDFEIPLTYAHGTEYACEDEFQKIENHKGILWLYEDQAHGGNRIEVGTYLYGWDTEGSKPVARFDYDTELILNNVPAESNIAKRIQAGLMPEMSTEYYCGTKTINGRKLQVGFHDSKGRPRFEGIAIVNWGNCGAGSCPSEVIEP